MHQDLLECFGNGIEQCRMSKILKVPFTILRHAGGLCKNAFLNNPYTGTRENHKLDPRMTSDSEKVTGETNTESANGLDVYLRASVSVPSGRGFSFQPSGRGFRFQSSEHEARCEKADLMAKRPE